MTKLHLFAVNNTVLNLDCSISWKEFTVKEGLAPADAADRAAEFRQAIEAGNVNGCEFTRFLLAEFTGKSKPEVMKITGKHFEEKIKPAIRQAAFDYIKQLIRKGESVAFLTSIDTANAYYVALHCGVADFVATSTVITNDAFTDTPADTCALGAGKIFQLGRICERFGITPADVAYYGSSADDLPLLKVVGKPVAVMPSAALREYAEKADWQIIDNWAE